MSAGGGLEPATANLDLHYKMNHPVHKYRPRFRRTSDPGISGYSSRGRALVRRFVALGAPSLLARLRIRRPAVAPTIAVIAIITEVAAVAAAAVAASRAPAARPAAAHRAISCGVTGHSA